MSYAKEALLNEYQEQEKKYLGVIFYICKTTWEDCYEWLYEDFYGLIESAAKLPDTEEAWSEASDFPSIVAQVAREKALASPKNAEFHIWQANVVESAWHDVLTINWG